MNKRGGWNGNEASRDERRAPTIAERDEHYISKYADLLQQLNDYVPCPFGFEGGMREFCSAGSCTDCLRDRAGSHVDGAP